MALNVYLGFDSREPESYRVAVKSLHRHASQPVHVTPLRSDKLAETGLLRRPQDTRGQRYDILSNAAASTEFAISRFLVPILAQTGWALFADSDVVFMDDVAKLFALADSRYAVMCVKHRFDQYDLIGTKMDGQQQTAYPKKLWSSVCLFNCDHPANKRLSLVDVQERPGRDLHGFFWLHESEIGEMPARYNWLVGLQPMPESPAIVHYTLGTPELGVTSDYDRYWHEYAA